MRQDGHPGRAPEWITCRVRPLDPPLARLGSYVWSYSIRSLSIVSSQARLRSALIDGEGSPRTAREDGARRWFVRGQPERGECERGSVGCLYVRIQGLQGSL